MTPTIDCHRLSSTYLQREVTIDFYLPPGQSILSPGMELLLINDGQDLIPMNFPAILADLYQSERISPLLCVGIHCGPDRRNEYGTVSTTDYQGLGAKAPAYSKFIFQELLPFLETEFPGITAKNKSFCGFSLGGLTALDIVWNHPETFGKAGVFSGSLWWRTKSQNDPLFDETKHRIIHNEIRNGTYAPGLKFFFSTGTLDETADRNNNGIIDSIDDTLALIDELKRKGYDPVKDIRYLELSDGRHDVATWGRAFPDFLTWGWGIR